MSIDGFEEAEGEHTDEAEEGHADEVDPSEEQRKRMPAMV